MDKKFIILILLAFILAAMPLWARWQMDSGHESVELIMDGREFQEMSALEYDLNWESLAEAGVTGAALPAYTLEDLTEMGRIARRSPAELELFEELTPENADSPGGGAVFYFPDGERTASQAVLEAWQDLYDVRIDSYNGGSLVHFPHWNEEFADLIPGFDTSILEEVLEAGLRPSVRFKNQPDQSLNEVLLGEVYELGISSLIFTGDEVAGYPAHLEDTAEIMDEYGITYGFIEPFLADQDGDRALAGFLEHDLIRVHSMQRDELAQSTLDEVSDRYMRAVQERNVRYLYLRGFPPQEGFSGRGDAQLQLAGMISSELESEGFLPGNPSPMEARHSGALLVLMISLLVLAAGLIWINDILPYLFRSSGKILVMLAVSGAGVLLFFYSFFELILFRQITALAAALVFPALAGSALVDFDQGQRSAVSALSRAVLAALAGGVLVSAALATFQFYNQVEIFRGVKVAFLLPLMMTGFYFLIMEYGGNGSGQGPLSFLEQLWKKPLLYGHIALLMLAAAVLIIYIGRTGNLPLIPVPPWEVAVRSRLEELLAVRPRFKEFLIGHPFLFLLPLIKKYLPFSAVRIGAIMLAVIGQITVVNSFSHLHTPLRVTVLRTFHGYWLALPITILLAFLVYIIHRLLIYLELTPAEFGGSG